MVAEGKILPLVLDLRHVNKHIKHTKFRYESWSTLSEMLNKGNYFTIFDLTSGYHHIEIHPEHSKFIGLNGLSKSPLLEISNFSFYNSAQHQHVVFTKVLRLFAKRWRGRGMWSTTKRATSILKQKENG